MDYYNEDALRAEIARNHLTVSKTADKLGISQRQFSSKLKTGSWWMSEAYKLSVILNMDEQRFNEVFFYPKSHTKCDIVYNTKGEPI